MADIFHDFKRAYSNSLRLKALVFGTLVGSMVLSIFGWSLFQDDDFGVSSGKYEYLSKTEGTRSTHPTYYVREEDGNILSMKGWAKNCFYIIDFGMELHIQFVEFGGDNVVVACSQGDVKLNASEGVLVVRESLIFKRYIAKFSLVLLFFSFGGLFFFLKSRKIV